jgi:CheY-like chemotaxis protein
MIVDMETTEKRRVLFVDDEPEILASIEDSLEEFKPRWEMRFAKDGEEELAILDRDHTHLMVTDLQMPGMDGEQLLAEARRRHPGPEQFRAKTQTVHLRSEPRLLVGGERHRGENGSEEEESTAQEVHSGSDASA